MKNLTLIMIGLMHLHAYAETDLSLYQEAERRTQHLLSVLRASGDMGYIGEPISQLQHALQAAYHATLMGDSDELIIAALFHDIGHQLPGESMDGWGTVQHEEIGADFLKKQGFSYTVCELVRSHIEAKRYLCADPIYYAKLSEGSKQSMRYQSGPMNEQEAEAFRQDPLFEQKLKLRHCDDKAKDPDGIVPDLDAYYQLVVDHLYKQLLHTE